MESEKQTTLYFIRHGQTMSNKNGIQQGSVIDDYLNTTGVMEAKQLANVAEFLGLDIIFTSYLHRAEETASIIQSRLIQPVQIHHDFRLKERDFGSLSGKTKKDWDKLLPNHEELERLQMYDYHYFGGENVEDVRQRVISCILDICENYDHNNIGIVTHAGVIRLMLFHFPDIIRIYHESLGPQESQIGNADLYQWDVTSDKIANLKSLLKKP